MIVKKKHGDFTNTPIRIVIFLLVALILIALMAIALSNEPFDNTESPPPQLSEAINISPHTLIYGSWSAGSSFVVAYDLTTGKEGVIAKLPDNIKNISVPSSNTLLYINKTDRRDYGSEIVQYDLLSKKPTVIYRASDSFGIDKYILSPDTKQMAVWEVQVNEESQRLRNGRSRVYTAMVGEVGKNLIYDEIATDDNPIRYPIAILNNGTVFMDRFLPNSGAGWAYGMSVSNFIGTQRTDITSMQNGTYASKPVLSPDGQYLVFIGYNGNNGDGKTIVDGFRRAIVQANTVELLNTQSRLRTKLENLPLSNIYTAVSWVGDSNNLLIASNNRQEAQTGNLFYDQETKTPTLLSSPSNIEGHLLQQLSQSAWLYGLKNKSFSTIGNLGNEYDSPYTLFSVYNPHTKKITPLRTESDLMQLIAVLPATSFGSFQLLAEREQPADENLLLQTFTVKTQLAPTREELQSSPVPDNNMYASCTDLIQNQILAICGDTPTTSNTSNTYQSCSENLRATERIGHACY